MIIGIFSDAHGNLLAFEQSIRLFNRLGVERLFFLGDAVGYYPDGDVILSQLERLSVQCICGNHDAMLLGKLPIDRMKDEVYGLEEQKQSIGKKHIEFLQSWPLRREVLIDKINVLMVHGSPSNPLNEYIYPNSDVEYFEKSSYDMIFLGHTHRPFIKKIGKTTVVNVGSCGLPRDQGDLLSIAILDTITRKVSIVHEKLDIALLKTKYTQVHSSVLQCLDRKATNSVVCTRLGENAIG
jgi:putative phosphoesterase